MATATILAIDWDTQGDWIGVYGSEGYILPEYVSAPSWLSYSLAYTNFTGYPPDDADRRMVLIPPGGSSRQPKTYQDTTQVGVTLTPSDGTTRYVAVSARVGGTVSRRCRVDVLDASTSTVLASYTVDREYVSGVWLFIAFTGAITVTIVKTDPGTSVQSGGYLFGPVQAGRIAALTHIDYGILG